MSIAFIGSGNMASALIRGLVAQSPHRAITVSSPSTTRHLALHALGVRTTTDNAQAIIGARIVVLAIKPQKAAEVVPGLAATWQPEQLLVSVLAGTPCRKLEGWLPAGARVVRAMPNTPLAIGLGMTGLCPGSQATDADVDAAEALFAPMGQVLRISDEGRMDALTAVSGSGPAYFFRMAECLVDAAMALGFTRDEAVLLVGQTGRGAWQYLLDSGFQATRLREQVTSPGGTTAAALAELEKGDLHGLWQRALAAAEARGRALGKG